MLLSPTCQNGKDGDRLAKTRREQLATCPVSISRLSAERVWWPRIPPPVRPKPSDKNLFQEPLTYKLLWDAVGEEGGRQGSPGLSVLKPAIRLVWPLPVPLPLWPAVWWDYFQHERQEHKCPHVPASQSETLAWRSQPPPPPWVGRQGLKLIPGNFMAPLSALLSASLRDSSNNKMRHDNNSDHLLITYHKPGTVRGISFILPH